MKFLLITVAMVAALAGSAGLCHGSATCVDPADPAPAAQKDRAKYNAYDHAEGDYKFRLVVPDGLKVVRGILVVGPPLSGDTRAFHEQVWYREFLNLHGFAFLGAKDFYLNDYKTLQAAIKQLAADSKHPELVDAPIATTGLSAGGGFARRLVKEVPDRVIAAVIVCSTFQSGHFTPEAVHRPVPVCVITGEREGTDGLASRLEPVLAERRAAGAEGSAQAPAERALRSQITRSVIVRLLPAGPGIAQSLQPQPPVEDSMIVLETGWPIHFTPGDKTKSGGGGRS